MSKTNPLTPKGLKSADATRVQVRLHNAADKIAYNWLQYNAPDLNKRFLLDCEQLVLPLLAEYLARAKYDGRAASAGERLF